MAPFSDLWPMAFIIAKKAPNQIENKINFKIR